MMLLLRCMLFCLCLFCKQKTACERRISDWSSDVCSSDLAQMRTRADEIALDPPRGIAAFFAAKLRQVGHRRDGDDLLEQVRRDDARLQRSIAAIGPTDDRQPAGRRALCDQPAPGGGDAIGRAPV